MKLRALRPPPEGQAMADQQTGLGAFVQRQGQLGSKVAFADAERDVSFADFERRVNRLVDGFHQLGLRRGDRVALLSRNCVSAVECVAACRAGFIVVPLNWRLGTGELLALLRDCAPTALVCDGEWAGIADADIVPHIELPVRVVFGPARAGWRSFEAVIAEGNEAAAHPDATCDETALLIYTSGTTGTPKAARISHAGLLANGIASAREAIGVTDRDTILCVMPMFHVGGLCYYLLPSYMAGATSVLRPMFQVDDLVDSLERLAITNVHLVPTMVADLVAHPRAAQAAARLQRIVYAGSSMPVALLERAMRVLGSCAFSQSYGSTEGGIITTLGPEEHRRAAASGEHAHLLQSCGRPLSGTDLRVVDAEGNECPIGTPGEVLVRSDRTMAGYWNLPEKTAELRVGEHLRTGDIGYRDGEGYFYLIDRKGDMIVTGGENVFPSEVEQALHRHPDVAEAAVFGVADARWIEKVVAAVVLRPGSEATSASITQHLKQHLASYKCPKTIHIVPELPRTGVGKVSRKHLRQIYGAATTTKETP
jgi:acyl-CoA synthetase (AMP-forming)/AMP-acid ligase II